MTLWNLFRPRTVKSKDRRAINKVPAACYDECNNALLVGESTGERPSLCDPNSEFQISASNCATCIQYGNQNGTNDPVEKILPAFQQFIAFCSANTTTNSTLLAIAESVVRKESSILAQKSSLSDSQASLNAQLTSLGYQLPTNSTTETPSPTAMSTSQHASPAVTTVLITPSASTTPTPTPKPHSNTSTIIAALIVLIVVISLICIGVFLFLRRRRRRLATQGDNSDEKPQLHSDDIKPIQLELDSSQVSEMKVWKEHPPNVAELPALEVVGSEMDADSRPQQQHDATGTLSSDITTSHQTGSPDDR